MTLALLLISALFLSMLMVVDVAWKQNQESVRQESQLLHNAWQEQQREMVTELRDYAFWQEAWLHMYLTIDPDWAWHQQNLGPSLFSEHHYDGVFVVDVDNRTRYAMIDGKLSSLTRWRRGWATGPCRWSKRRASRRVGIKSSAKIS